MELIKRSGLALLLVTSLASAQEIEVKGLFSGKALLSVDGEVKLLKVGDTYRDVTLVSADSRGAVIEMDGQRRELSVSRRVSASYRAADAERVRVPPDANGHYRTPARINSKPVQVMVDTGASAVAMSLPQARALGINYRAGRLIKVSTASGVIDSYLVSLDSVSVGGVRVDNVEALVNVSDFPGVILLGNSYLKRVKMYQQNHMLVLESRF